MDVTASQVAKGSLLGLPILWATDSFAAIPLINDVTGT